MQAPLGLAGVPRGIDRLLIRELATCGWVAKKQGIVVCGATGTGKTFLACAFGQHALRRRYKVLYRRTSRLLEDLTLARADAPSRRRSLDSPASTS